MSARRWRLELRERTGIETLASELTYDLRSGEPDSLDAMVATTFANVAMDLVESGVTGQMIAIQDGKYAHTALPDPALGPRRSTSRASTTSSVSVPDTTANSVTRCCWSASTEHPARGSQSSGSRHIELTSWALIHSCRVIGRNTAAAGALRQRNDGLSETGPGPDGPGSGLAEWSFRRGAGPGYRHSRLRAVSGSGAIIGAIGPDLTTAIAGGPLRRVRRPDEGRPRTFPPAASSDVRFVDRRHTDGR